MVDQKIIEVCRDPKGWNSPIFCVRKKNGDVRIVANFKPTLNRELTAVDPYPVPDMQKLITHIGSGNNYFAVLDLRQGFWQIQIKPEDRHVTAFCYKGVTYQYTKLSMGLTSAGSIFSRCVSEAFERVGGEVRQNLCTYIDDNMFLKCFVRQD